MVHPPFMLLPETKALVERAGAVVGWLGDVVVVVSSWGTPESRFPSGASRRFLAPVLLVSGRLVPLLLLQLRARVFLPFWAMAKARYQT